MANTILFTPKAELDAKANLEGFIEVCSEHLTAFGANLRFDEDVWDVTDSIELKAKGAQRLRITFSTLESANAPVPEMMREPFRSFAKAYIRYMHGMRPTKSIGPRVAALRALEFGLVESAGQPQPIYVDAHAFNRAAQAAKEHFTAAV